MTILLNNLIVDIPGFSEERFKKGYSVYEVVRIFRGKPLFLKDNELRLINSIKKSNIHFDIKNLNLYDKINEFIGLNHIEEGNVKYVIHKEDGDGEVNEYLYEIDSKYPTGVDYMNGVICSTLRAIRENPGIKYINPALREQTDRIISKEGVYEVILRDRQDNITEGSRSNIFFIKEHTLYTAPASDVLSGTSRKRVIDICNTYGFTVQEVPLPYSHLAEFQSAFLTGTSPLILPIKTIDQFHFDVNNKLLRELMNLYFALLEKF